MHSCLIPKASVCPVLPLLAAFGCLCQVAVRAEAEETKTEAPSTPSSKPSITNSSYAYTGIKTDTTGSLRPGLGNSGAPPIGRLLCACRQLVPFRV